MTSQGARTTIGLRACTNINATIQLFLAARPNAQWAHCTCQLPSDASPRPPLCTDPGKAEALHTAQQQLSTAPTEGAEQCEAADSSAAPTDSASTYERFMRDLRCVCRCTHDSNERWIYRKEVNNRWFMGSLLVEDGPAKIRLDLTVIRTGATSNVGAEAH